MNPFSALYEQCNSGDPAEKYRDLPAFPRIIDVELTSACNYSCLFCPTGLHALTRKSGLMSVVTWRRLVDECEQHGTALRIIGWGEGLLHKDAVSFIAYASDAGLLTHLNSNASKITPLLAEQLVDAGLSSIKMSFQGVDRETYAEARQVDFFEGMIRAIKMMSDARGHRTLPFIAASTSITNETPEMVEAFRARLEPLVDQLSVGRTIFDFLDDAAARLKPKQRTLFDRARALDSADKIHPDPCPEVYDKLSISWDGTARVCCTDWDGITDLGKIGQSSIQEMWRHTVIEAYRKRLAKKEYTGPLCSVCYDYQALSGAQQ